MARSLPLILPPLMRRVQASIAVSAEAFSSLQTPQSSARAADAKLTVAAIASATDRERSMAAPRGWRRFRYRMVGSLPGGGNSGERAALISLTIFEGIQ